MLFRSQSLKLALAGAALAAMTSWANAAVFYNYVGSNFDRFRDSAQIPGSFDATNRITGWFEVSGAFGPNLPGTNITADLIDFSFTDGRNTFTPANVITTNVAVSTDDSGNIDTWGVSAGTGAPLLLGDQQTFFNLLAFPGIASDRSTIRRCVSLEPSGSCNAASEFGEKRTDIITGTWTISQDAPLNLVPAPTALPLLASALGLLGFAGWRRRRSAV